MARRSEAGLPSSSNEFNLKLFENALKDPATKDLVLKLLTSQNKNVFELFRNKPLSDAVKSPVRKLKKREQCESPTALLRRRELEKIHRPESAQSNSSEQSSASASSSTLPFEKIMKDIIVYVEIKSNGNDRSAGARALLRSMGATVRDQFTKDVTHVIFKDGSYQTYQRAQLLKVHFVSVLWLEAARRNGVKVPEKNYPALGTKNYDMNISLICSQMQKDYEDVIREEIRHSLQSGFPLPSTKSLVENRRKTLASSSRLFELSPHPPNGDQNEERESVLSKIRGPSHSEHLEKSSMILGESPTLAVDRDLSFLSRSVSNRLNAKSSDSFESSSILKGNNSDVLTSDSECSMVNGSFSGNSRDGVVIDDSFEGVMPLNSDEVLTSNMELTCSNDDEDSDSRSLISHRYISTRKEKNMTASMDLTNLGAEVSGKRKIEEKNNTGGVLKSLKGSILNSISYLTSKTQISKERDPKKTKIGDEENCIGPTADTDIDTDDDDFYKIKTPKLKNIYKPELIKLSSKELPRRKLIVNEEEENLNTAETVMSSLRISDNPMEKTNSNENKTGSTDMSSLRITDNSTEKRTSNENKTTSTEMSSLHISSDSKKVSTGTSLSSSKRKSSSSNMSSLRISSEQKNAGEDNAEKNESPLILKKTEENNLDITNEKNGVDQPVVKTPFVTERKKRKIQRKSTVNEDIVGNSDVPLENIDLKNDTKSSQTPKLSRTENLNVNKEKLNFQMDLKHRKEYHDKNREIELGCNEVENDTVKPVKKDILKTITNSDVVNSPFVNVRSRRRTLKTIIDKKEDNESNLKTRKSAKIEDQNLSDRVFENEFEEAESNRKTRNLRRTSKMCMTEKTEKNVDDSEYSLGENKKTPTKASVGKINEISNRTNKSEVSGRKPIVLLENILISPPNNILHINQPIRKSRRKTIVEPDQQCVVSSIPRSKENTEVTGEHREEKMESINTKSLEGRISKISRSKSESDVNKKNSATMRRSRRIRKLYDPDDATSNSNSQPNIPVNDTEEREKIRKEKVTKINNVVVESTLLSGNVLLTQKAMEYLEKNKNNQNEIKILFKSPESVLEKLGIDEKKKSEKKKEPEKKKESIMNLSSDEQVALADEFVHKKFKALSQPLSASGKTPSTRRSTRILSQKSLPTNRNRRSTLEFETHSQRVPKVRTKLKLDQKPTIVCTKMHKPDVQMFSQIVKKLGTFAVEDEVTSRTTHLVVGEVKRTINMLRALARGCWIVKHEWIFRSLEQCRWLPEENYEATDFSPAVQKCRLERSAFGPSYSMNIFLNCGLVYVAKSTHPRCSDLRELIILCKGKITRTPDNATIAVGAYFDECNCVNEYWILDSISSGKLKPLKKYLISKETTNCVSPSV